MQCFHPMMKTTSDIKIFWSVLVDYIIKQSEIRRVFIPGLAACIAAKILYIMSSRTVGKITKKLEMGESVIKTVFYMECFWSYMGQSIN